MVKLSASAPTITGSIARKSQESNNSETNNDIHNDNDDTLQTKIQSLLLLASRTKTETETGSMKNIAFVQETYLAGSVLLTRVSSAAVLRSLLLFQPLPSSEPPLHEFLCRMIRNYRRHQLNENEEERDDENKDCEIRMAFLRLAVRILGNFYSNVDYNDKTIQHDIEKINKDDNWQMQKERHATLILETLTFRDEMGAKLDRVDAELVQVLAAMGISAAAMHPPTSMRDWPQVVLTRYRNHLERSGDDNDDDDDDDEAKRKAEERAKKEDRNGTLDATKCMVQIIHSVLSSSSSSTGADDDPNHSCEEEYTDAMMSLFQYCLIHSSIDGTVATRQFFLDLIHLVFRTKTITAKDKSILMTKLKTKHEYWLFFALTYFTHSVTVGPVSESHPKPNQTQTQTNPNHQHHHRTNNNNNNHSLQNPNPSPNTPPYKLSHTLSTDSTIRYDETMALSLRRLVLHGMTFVPDWTSTPSNDVNEDEDGTIRSATMELVVTLMQVCGVRWMFPSCDEDLDVDLDEDGTPLPYGPISSTDSSHDDETKKHNSRDSSSSFFTTMATLSTGELRIVLGKVMADHTHSTPQIIDTTKTTTTNTTMVQNCIRASLTILNILLTTENDTNTHHHQPWVRLNPDEILRLYPSLEDALNVCVQFLEGVEDIMDLDCNEYGVTFGGGEGYPMDCILACSTFLTSYLSEVDVFEYGHNHEEDDDNDGNDVNEKEDNRTLTSSFRYTSTERLLSALRTCLRISIHMDMAMDCKLGSASVKSKPNDGVWQTDKNNGMTKIHNGTGRTTRWMITGEETVLPLLSAIFAVLTFCVQDGSQYRLVERLWFRDGILIDGLSFAMKSSLETFQYQWKIQNRNNLVFQSEWEWSLEVLSHCHWIVEALCTFIQSSMNKVMVVVADETTLAIISMMKQLGPCLVAWLRELVDGMESQSQLWEDESEYGGGALNLDMDINTKWKGKWKGALLESCRSWILWNDVIGSYDGMEEESLEKNRRSKVEEEGDLLVMRASSYVSLSKRS